MTPKRQLLIIVLLALALRLWGLDWGLPNAQHYFSYHPDEITVSASAVSIASTGDLNPHFFNYGSLYIYLLALPLALAGGAALAVATLAGRLLTVCFGAATVALLFAFARRTLGGRWAWAPSLLLAVLPLHVVHSHFATVDVPVAFFVLLALYLTVLAAERESLRLLAVAGAVSGLAAATKYNGGAVLLIPLAAAFITPRLRSTAFVAVFATAGAALAAFLLACPYALLDWPAFSQAVAFEMRHGRIGGTYAFLNTPPAPLYHLIVSLPNGATGLFIPIFLLGVVLAAVRRNAATTTALAWVVLWWLVIGLSREKFIRYLIPALPAMTLLACLPLAQVGAHRAWRWAVGGWWAFTLVVCVVWSAAHLRTFSAVDPRDRAAEWLRGSASPQRVIALLDIPWYNSPPICPWNGGLRSAKEFTDWNATATPKILPLRWDFAPLERREADYVVFAEVEVKDLGRAGDPRAKALYDALRAGYTLAATFDGKPRIHGFPIEQTYPPPDWEYVTPTLYVYRRADTEDGEPR